MDTVPHLKNPPMVMAIAKVEFAQLPAEKLSKNIENLHEKLRDVYPDIQSRIAKNVNVNINDQSNEVQSENISTWIFRSADQNWAIQLDFKGIIVVTKNYESSVDLCDRIEKILIAVNEAIKVTHTRFVGVRFVNKLDYRGEGEPSVLRNNYTQQTLPFAEGMAGSSYTARYKVDSNWLDIRCNLIVGGLEVTEDLLDLARLLNLGQETLNKVFLLLDFDCRHISNQYVEYDIEGLKIRLKEMINTCKKALAHTLTEDEIKIRT